MCLKYKTKIKVNINHNNQYNNNYKSIQSTFFNLFPNFPYIIPTHVLLNYVFIFKIFISKNGFQTHCKYSLKCHSKS